jgi:D-alanine-D-alanine ligase-like ATP-grasp enzyme/precorrin-6B methylase 2
MNVGIVHTVGSPCKCAEAISSGLRSLGHEVQTANSEEIALKAQELVRVCDLIIDHSDTLLGRGYLRFVVRSILEAHGAGVVGSCSKACQIADNKAAVKTILGKAGIPAPPGIVVTSEAWNWPSWLRPPFVVKSVFEHMSRGIRLAYTGEEARRMAANLIEQAQQPVMIEAYIPGKELAVSVIDGPGGLEVLPPLEWYSASENVFLVEKFKLVEPSGKTRPEASHPELSSPVLHELEDFARLAFKTLGLSDYARFDIRLTAGGTFFFLETNVTPSLEPLEAFAISARWAGLSYPELIDRILSSAIRRYRGRMKEDGSLNAGDIEIETPAGVHPPFPSSIELTKFLDIQPGERVLDLGCGSGILSVTAAKLGAKEVVSVDLDPLSLETTIINAQKNGAGGLIEVRAGTWFEALREKPLSSERNNLFDVIIATPPQTPAPEPFSPRYGGHDGTLHLFKIIDAAADFLEPDKGRLWLLAISLANPSAVLNRLKKHFQEVMVVHESERPFTADEYNTMNAGLMEYLLALRVSGKSDFIEKDDKTYVFRNLFIRAARPL